MAVMFLLVDSIHQRGGRFLRRRRQQQQQQQLDDDVVDRDEWTKGLSFVQLTLEGARREARNALNRSCKKKRQNRN